MSLGSRRTCPLVPKRKGGIAPSRRLWSSWTTLKWIPPIIQWIVCVWCNTCGLSCSTWDRSLENRRKNPSAKKQKGRAREWSRNRCLETLTIRFSISKLHPHICRCRAYIKCGWGNVPPIPRETLEKWRGSNRMNLSSVWKRGWSRRHTGNPSDHPTRNAYYICGSRWLNHPTS